MILFLNPWVYKNSKQDLNIIGFKNETFLLIKNRERWCHLRNSPLFEYWYKKIISVRFWLFFYYLNNVRSFKTLRFWIVLIKLKLSYWSEFDFLVFGVRKYHKSVHYSRTKLSILTGFHRIPHTPYPMHRLIDTWFYIDFTLSVVLHNDQIQRLMRKQIHRSPKMVDNWSL